MSHSANSSWRELWVLTLSIYPSKSSILPTMNSLSSRNDLSELPDPLPEVVLAPSFFLLEGIAKILVPRTTPESLSFILVQSKSEVRNMELSKDLSKIDLVWLYNFK